MFLDAFLLDPLLSQGVSRTEQELRNRKHSPIIPQGGAPQWLSTGSERAGVPARSDTWTSTVRKPHEETGGKRTIAALERFVTASSSSRHNVDR